MGPKSRWRVAAALASIGFFALAVSNEVYVATSPPGYEFHIALRKTYSVGAFAVVGYCIDRSLAARQGGGVIRLMLIMAAYSAAIEVAQTLGGSLEGLRWNGIDVLCGALGGAIASGADLLLRKRARGQAGWGRRRRDSGQPTAASAEDA